MLKNNNGQITRKIMKKSIFTNRTRNIFAILAIMLTTFMIFTVFSIGISFMNNYQIMETRINGTEAQAFLPYASEEQLQEIREMDEVQLSEYRYRQASGRI